MPRTAIKSKRVSSKDKNAEKKIQGGGAAPPLDLLAALVCGVILGFSAPGFDQWYIAWFGLAPFFLLVASSLTLKQAALRGLVFGTAYNLVYLNWFLALHPLNWMNLNDWQSVGLSALSWIIVALHQGLMYGILAFVIRFLPLCGGAVPRKVEEKWKIPALLSLPIIYQLAFEKLLNAHDLLGVPWSMIEYSQYKQTAFVQIAHVIGGIGVGAIVVLVNVALATLLATVTKKFSVKSLAASSKLAAVCALLSVMLLVSACTIYGFYRLQTNKISAGQNLTILQGNINIEMQKMRHKYTLHELMEHYARMLKRCAPGFCVWTESALPAYLKESPRLQGFLKSEAQDRKLDMIVGAIDSDGDRPYNSAFGISSTGQILPQVYHKRYLVPVGEYTPEFVKYLPEFLRKLTDTPAGTGFAAGKRPVVLDFSGRTVAPLICFETIAPELLSESVRNGGELIVNISDLAWFHNSMVGDQTSACVVFRALESGRYFIYAANTGPSMVVSPLGIVEAKSSVGDETLLNAKVALLRDLTLFTQWFY